MPPSIRRSLAAWEALGQFEKFPWAKFLRFMEVLVGFESTLVLSRFSRKAKMLRLNVDPPSSALLLMVVVEPGLQMVVQISKFWLFLMLFVTPKGDGSCQIFFSKVPCCHGLLL